LEDDLVRGEWPDFAGGHASDQHSGCDDLTRPNHGSCGDERVLTDLGTIENNCPDPNQSAIPHTAPVDDRAMSDCDVVSQQGGKAPFRNMQRGLILNIRPLTDSNVMHIAA
jgi:hypothetical protein